MGKLVSILLIGFYLIVFSLIIYGLLTKPQKPSIFINTGTAGTFNKQCFTEKVSCTSDDQCASLCSEAQEGSEVVCQALPDTAGLTDVQKKILGAKGFSNTNNSMASSKYCVPARATMQCNESTGGIPVFSGWSGAVDNMNFDCLCSYPLWASSRVCNTDTGSCTGNCMLNPGICQPGTFRWDLKKESVDPEASLCECDPGYTLLIDSSGLPRCVPEDIQTFYEDTDLREHEILPLIGVDSINIYNRICDSNSTLCPTGCCNGIKNAVCCAGADFCCPSEFPVCDIPNKRCLQANTKCGDKEEKCAEGCCPTGNVCCGNGKGCCPKEFPMCDPENNRCNPKLIPTIANTKANENQTQCGLNTCDKPGATCCGTGQTCCPSDYPVCDTKNGMCKQIT